MLIIVLILVGGLVLTYLGSLLFVQKDQDGKPIPVEPEKIPDINCCGAHEVCEKDTLLSATDEVVYYDDEELDQFKYVSPQDYTSEQTEQFREILFSMRDEDVAGWLRSLQLRNIELPYAVREEALMIVADVRDIIRGARVV